MRLDQFDIAERLYGGGKSEVFRGTRRADGVAVVIKVPASSSPSSQEFDRFRREARLAVQVGHPGVVVPLELVDSGGTIALVMPDTGAVPLSARLTQPLSTPEFLVMARSLAATLAAVHDAGVVHRDIKPDNIVLSPDGAVQLVDFGLATELQQGLADRQETGSLVGTLPWMSPELTGRLNRPVGYRTDLYSLGATFFAMLTARPPFEDEDALALVHAHIARQPPVPHELEPSVPPALSQIVLRLLAKDPDERYQSARGLLDDLTRCSDALAAGQTIEPFELGTQDAAGRLVPCGRLHGRDEELDRLSKACHTVIMRGRPCTALVTGPAGVGKSALVGTLLDELLGRGILVASAKCPYDSAGPLAPIALALDALATDLLAGQATDLDALGQTLVDALGPGVEVVARVSPAMGPLLGEFIARDSQRDPENSAARRRALQALFSLVTSLAHERPIALHIDDLQWADADTIELLEQLALSRGRHGLLLVLSWRSEEIGDGHRLRQLLQVLARRGDPAALCRVELSDLPLEAVSLMVADIIATPPPLVAPLAERLVALTHGNPFYVSRLMTEIHQQQFLWFDTSQRAWAWDLDAVSAIGAQANVVEWLSSRLGLLSPPGRRALSAAACTASAVSVDLIAAATGQGEAETLAGLMEPARLGFLTPIGSAQHRFRFVHDRVREAALQTLEPAERAVLHAAIGRTLLARWDGAGSIPFAAIDQLNRGVAEVRDPAERATLAQHNLEAARRARAAAGFGAAADYCEAGLALGAGDTALVSALRIELAELCRALRRLDRALELLVEAEREASDRTQRLEVLRLRVLVLIDGHRYDEALKAGVAAGALVDIHLPTDPGKGRVARELVAVKWALRGGALDDPMSLPRLNDPDIEVAMHALVIAGAGAYVMSPEFLAAVNLRVITLSVKHGRHPQLATAMMFYAVLLCGPLGDVPGGAAVGKAANALAGRADETSLRAAALFMYEAMVRHWAEPRGRTAARFEAVARVALETGQLDMAAFAHHMVLDDALLSGRPLSELEALCEETVGADLALNQIDKHHMNLRLWGLVRALLGWNEAPVLLEPRAASLAHYDQVAYPTGQAMVAAFDLMVAVYLRQHEEAVRAADELVRRSESITGSHWVGWGTVLGAIARLQHSGSTAVPAASKALKQVTRWARHNPTDYEHRRLLLAAELDRVAGRWAAADQGYEAAIARVAVHGWTPERALYLELAGRARIELGSARQGRADLREAVGLYARWGATAVIARLEDEFGAFERRVSDIDESATRAESSLGSSNAVLDLGALALAGRALGSEIQLSAVLEELMGVALEVSGARRAVLVRLTDAGARVDAEARVEPAHLEVLQGVALPSSDPAGVACVSVRLVEYVRRTREPLALDEALRTGPLASDPWVARVRARSLLAQPLTHQGRMVGVLILENDLLPGAFPKRRLAVLNLLSVQMGSAIENAALYADLEQALTHQRQLTTAYSRFVPRQLLGLMGKADITEVALGDQVQREMTVLFSDIRDFSTITETMTPAEAFAFVNSFLSRMEPVIAQHGGFIDKYIGDAIMGLFEAPERAVAAAFGMLEALDGLNAERAGPPIRIGIGIHHGHLMLGTVGGRDRMDGTVIGDAVNLAARIESATKDYGKSLLITGAVVQRLEGTSYVARSLDTIQVKGKSEWVEIFAIDG